MESINTAMDLLFSDTEGKTPEMPYHWKNDFEHSWGWLRPLLKLAFTVLVVIAFGQDSLKRKWELTQEGEEGFAPEKDRIAARITTITVVVSNADAILG
jgi:hypothetical protein